MAEEGSLRADFVLLSYVQKNEKAGAWIQNVPTPPLEYRYQWTSLFELSDRASINIVVHSRFDLDEAGQNFVLRFAEKQFAEGIKNDPNYEKIITGEFKPQLDEQDKAIIEFIEELNKGIEDLRRSLIIQVTSNDAPEAFNYPENFPYTEAKFHTLSFLMIAVGHPPGGELVNQAIPYRRLKVQILEWLEQAGIPARGQNAPFVANWAKLFEYGKRLPTPDNAERFYGHLIHCLLVETQLVMNQFYYEKLQLNLRDIPISLLAEMMGEAELQRRRAQAVLVPDIRQLYARNFLDFHIIMVRALWDKIMRLACLAFDVNPNVESITDSLNNLRTVKMLSPVSKFTFEIFLGIAQEQLKDKEQGGWLRAVRDHLIHDTGQHSFGVLPQKKSLESSFELWNRIKDEHSWLREAMMALFATLIVRAWMETKKDK